MIGQKNITTVVIGKDDDVATTSETRADLIAGQIGIFLVGSKTANGASALTAGQRFQVVYKRNDGALIESPVIEYNNITAKNAVSTPVLSTQRIRTLGYNGTTGAIVTANSEDYVVHYEWDDGTKTTGRAKPTKFLAYKSDASATQEEIASGLAINAIKNNQAEVNKVVIPRVLIANAGAALGTSVDTLTFVNGSKYFTADDIDDATGAGDALAVGDYIRIPERNDMEVTLTGTSGTATVLVAGISKTATFDTDLTTTAANFVTANAAAYAKIGITLTSSAAVLTFVKVNGSAISASVGTVTNATGDLAGTAVWDTNTTDPCYKITALDTTNDIGTLNMAYQGESFNAEDGSFVRIASATAAAADAGFALVGQPLPYSPGLKKYAVTDFWLWKIGSAFGTTPEDSISTPSKGNGTYEEISEVEWFLRGNRGEPFRVADYPVSYTADADSSKLYQEVVVDYKDNNATSIDSEVLSFGSLYIATETESSSTVHTNLKTVFGI